MRQLRNRVASLESKANPPSLVTRFVWCEVGQTDAEALDAYGRHRLGVNDNVVLISWQGGTDAAA